MQGGMPGVSDSFTSALWVLDWLPEISKTGARAQNFHGAPVSVSDAAPFASFEGGMRRGAQKQEA